jgi:thymidylate kinase
MGRIVAAPALLFVTGASGAGKTTAVRALEARRLAGVRCFHFDSIGVPSPEEMIRDYGSGEAWQAATTVAWIATLMAEPAEVAVLDGQARPSIIRAALRTVAPPPTQIVLLDCTPEERARRLAGLRGQPELASPQMSAWAAYLRGQADALELPVVDTTGQPIEAVTDALFAEVERLRAIRAGAG